MNVLLQIIGGWRCVFVAYQMYEDTGSCNSNKSYSGDGWFKVPVPHAADEDRMNAIGFKVHTCKFCGMHAES